HYTYAKDRNNIERVDDILNPTRIWGPEANLHDHMLTFTTRWDLPFGKGRTHLNHLPRVVDGFLGGWVIQTLSSFGSGSHLTPSIYGLSDFANNNWNAWIPDVIPGANPNLPRDQRTQQRYFNTPVLNDDRTAYVELGAFKVPGCPDSDPLCLSSTPESIGRLG